MCFWRRLLKWLPALPALPAREFLKRTASYRTHWIYNLAWGLVICKYSSFKRWIKDIGIHEQWRLGRLHELDGLYQYLFIDGPRESMILLGAEECLEIIHNGPQVVLVPCLDELASESECSGSSRLAAVELCLRSCSVYEGGAQCMVSQKIRFTI